MSMIQNHIRLFGSEILMHIHAEFNHFHMCKNIRVLKLTVHMQAHVSLVL